MANPLSSSTRVFQRSSAIATGFLYVKSRYELSRDMEINGIVYMMRNKITGQIYIGQTKVSLSRRLSRHTNSKTSYLSSAINKYGIQSFDVTVIDTASSKEVLLQKECYWIAFHNSMFPNGYNMTLGGEGGCGHSLSEESKQKLRDRKVSPETRRKLSKSLTAYFCNLGDRRGEVTKKRVDACRMRMAGTKGMYHSPETRAKISESVKAKAIERKKLEQLISENNTLN